jgi:hypothetical protein
MYKYLLLLSIVLGSCCNRKTAVQSYTVVKVWQEKNVSEVTKISPKFLALLSNKDTVPCLKTTKVGDKICYKTYKKE